MKRCPECRRDYYDDSLLYCLDDGSMLLEGPRGDTEQTMILAHSPPDSAESRTRIYEDAPETVRQQQVTETTTAPRRKSRVWIAVFGIVLVAAIGSLSLWYWRNGSSASHFSTAAKFNIKRLTTTGKVDTTGISRDGRYVAYVMDVGDKQSIHLLQVATGSDVEIVPPVDARVRYPNFSRDGEYVYYTQHVNNAGTLYQVPILGGTPRQIRYDIDSGAGVSPDGKTLAFIHEYALTQDEGANEIMLADSDGSNVRSIAKLEGKEGFLWESFTPAWSADGKSLAGAAIYETGKNESQVKLITVNVADSSIHPFSDSIWNMIDGIAWLRDGSIIVSGALRTGASDFTIRLWLVKPGSPPEPLTTDLGQYRGISMTDDGASLLTAQLQDNASLWVAPANDSSRASRIMQETAYFYDMSWTPDGRIMFVSTAGQTDIWLINADGSNKRRLTSGCGCDSPVMTSDGRYIVYMRYDTPADGSIRYGHVWRMDASGANQRPLTNGPGEMTPLISKDGGSVIFRQAGENSTDTLWKVPIDGGAPVQLSFDRMAFSPTVSPTDGKIAYMWLDPTQQFAPMISIIGPDGGKPISSFRSPTDRLYWIQFTPDGRSLAYLSKTDNNTNVWAIPADGKGPPKQLTNFKDETIFQPVTWSADGKQTAAIRGTSTTDAVLLTVPK